jgi:hypothetical protein
LRIGEDTGATPTKNQGPLRIVERLQRAYVPSRTTERSHEGKANPNGPFTGAITVTMLPNSTHLTQRLVDAHIEELRRAGVRSRLARVPTDDPSRSAGTLELTITIRAARSADESALRMLAERDSAAVPAAPVLIAEADGELRAAVSLHDGAAIAHPRHHTTWMVQLLHARAAQLRAPQLRQRLRVGIRIPGRRWAL